MLTSRRQLEAAEAQIIRGRKKYPNDPESGPEADLYDDGTIDDPKDERYVDEDAEEYDGPRGFVKRLGAWWHTLWYGRKPAHGDIDPFVELFRQTNYFNRVWNLVFNHPRVRRASLAAAVVMLSQQLCGVSKLSLVVMQELTTHRSTFSRFVCSLDLFKSGFKLTFKQTHRVFSREKERILPHYSHFGSLGDLQSPIFCVF